MELRKYGILFETYLKEIHPAKYYELLKNNSLMHYILEEEQYLYRFADMTKLYLKSIYPEPKTHEFTVMAKYNLMIKNMVEEYVRHEITKIV